MLCLAPPPKKIEYQGGFWELPQDFPLLDGLLLDSQPKGITFQHDPHTKHREGYELFITQHGVTLRFCTDRGRFYGLQTLRQIVAQKQRGCVPCLSIHDEPDFPLRAVSLDVSRDRVPLTETLTGLVDLWASWKINQLQLYIEHTFAFSRHKKVWEHASPFSAEELRALDEYCSARGIELVATRNSFGHMERWLQHPEYHHLAEAPDGYTDPWGVFRPHSSTLAPTVPEVIPFLENIFDEFLPCFKSELCNVGGDEPFELGQGRSKELCEQKGLGRVYSEFLCTLYDMIGKRGKKMLCYGDIITHHPDCIQYLPKDLTVVDWGYERDHPFEKEALLFAEAKMPFYLCAGTSAWNSVGGRWTNARGNILNAAIQGLTYGAQGFIVSEWGDNGHMQQHPVPLPGYLLGAAASWNAGDAASLDVFQALALQVFHHAEGSLLSQALLKLATICDSVAQLENATVLGIMPIRHVFPYYTKELSQFQSTPFSELREQLDDILSLLSAVSAPENECYKKELVFTARYLDHSAQLCVQTLGKSVKPIEKIPRKVRQQLDESLDHLIDEYRARWMERSRKGGLKESLARLESLSILYRKGA